MNLGTQQLLSKDFIHKNDATLTFEYQYGSFTAIYDSSMFRYSATGPDQQDAIKHLARENFSPETSYFKALMWCAGREGKGYYNSKSMRINSNNWHLLNG